MAIKVLKFKLYNKKRYSRQYDEQCEILRKVWNLCVALYEYCEFDKKQKYAFENGFEYSSPKNLEFYLDIWKKFFEKYPEEFDKLFFIIDKGEYMGEKMCVLSANKDNGYMLSTLITKFKTDDEFKIYVPKDSKMINSESIANVCTRYGKSLKAHISKRKTQKKSSAPKFKRYGEYHTIFFRRIPIDLKNKTIKLPIFKNVKVFNPKYLDHIIELTLSDDIYKSNQVSVIKEADGIFMTIMVDYQSSEEQEHTFVKGSSVGMDMGIKRLCSLSDGTYYENPKFLNKSQSQMIILQRKLVRKASYEIKTKTVDGVETEFKYLTKQQSSAYKNTQKDIQKLHLKIKRQRLELYKTIINELANKYETFVIEDLKLGEMIRKEKPIQDENGKYLKNNQFKQNKINRGLSDAAIGIFINTLTHKVGEKRVIAIDPKNTSQQCNACGHTEKDNRKYQYKFKCTSCGHRDNADTNAAKNILKLHLNT